MLIPLFQKIMQMYLVLSAALCLIMFVLLHKLLSVFYGLSSTGGRSKVILGLHMHVVCERLGVPWNLSAVVLSTELLFIWSSICFSYFFKIASWEMSINVHFRITSARKLNMIILECGKKSDFVMQYRMIIIYGQ